MHEDLHCLCRLVRTSLHIVILPSEARETESERHSLLWFLLLQRSGIGKSEAVCRCEVTELIQLEDFVPRFSRVTQAYTLAKLIR